MQTSESELDLRDRQAIVDVTIRYCWAIDGGDWGDLADVFTPDAEADFGLGAVLTGVDAIRDVIRRMLSPLDASQHMVTNHRVEVREGQTHSRCYFHAQHVRRGLEAGANYIVAGIYHDAWTKTPAGWRIRARRLEVLWTEGNPAVLGPPPAAP